MEFNDVLAARRMVRNYDGRPVTRTVLERIASAALRGPSAGYSQGVAVVVVTEAELRQKIAELGGEPEYVTTGFDPWISSAPAHLVITVSEQIYRDRYSEADKLGPDGQPVEWPVPYWWVDAGAALMAALLAAVNEGLAAGFLGVHNLPELARLLHLPDHHSPIGVVTIGHPLPDRRSSSLRRGRKPTETTIHWQQWSDLS